MRCGAAVGPLHGGRRARRRHSTAPCGCARWRG